MPGPMDLLSMQITHPIFWTPAPEAVKSRAFLSDWQEWSAPQNDNAISSYPVTTEE